MPAIEKRPLLAEDLYDFELVSEARIAPDGEKVIFCLQRVDRAAEEKYINLWLAPLDGGPARPFTTGEQVDTKPRWSPDGRQLAFLSNRDDEDQKQIYLIPTDGGEARRLTDLQGEFESFIWSPDGRWLLCQFRRQDKEAREREADARREELGIVARHITRVFFKLDGAGYLPEERWHLWLIDTHSGDARPLTDGPIHDEISPCWSPDGRQIAFFSNRSDDPDLNHGAVDLYVIPVDGGEMRLIETPLGPKSLPAWSPDGRWLTYIGRERLDQWWRNSNIWLVPADVSGPARNLTGRFDIQADNSTLGDIADRPTVHPCWSPDGKTIYFQMSRHGRTSLQAVSLDGGPLRPVIDEPGVVGAFSLDRAGHRIACTFGDFLDPGQVWLAESVEAEDVAFRPLTDFNSQLLAGVDLGQVEEVWFEGAVGNELQGWIVKPPDFDPAKKYPSILEIHGGPSLQYGATFMHEFHFLAGQGYVVAFCNPRGGQGYGEVHSRAIENNWGTADYADVMAWADHLAEQPYVDPARMGVAGGSYGGYMTSWIIGHTDRFRAAVAQRVVSNLVSMWGSSDFNWSFQRAFGGRPPWEDLENYWRQSPMAHIGQAKTPTLVIHSEQDMRCDLEQGLQVFVALKWLGVDTELVLFPEEPHGLSRGGRTDRRVARLEHMLRWFDRYLA